jgi:hypothetical protein
MPNPTKLLRGHHWSYLPAPPQPAADPTAALLPSLEQLAADSWLLAQKSPSLPADPALVAAATRLLARLRRLGPERRLVPDLAPGIRLHALAVALRQAHAALVRHLARQTPPPRSTEDELDDITHLEALILRGFATTLAERNDIKLPPELQPAPPPPPEPAAPGRPPRPLPHIRKVQLTHENTRRRVRKAVQDR